MPAKRAKGVTFKLVHQSYDDPNEEAATVMVPERELRRHLPAAQLPSHRLHRSENNNKDKDAYYNNYNYNMNSDEEGEEYFYNEAELGDFSSTHESHSVSAAGVVGGVRLPDEEAYMNKRNLLRAQDPNDDEVNKAKKKNNNSEDEDEEDEKLFDDQEEVEFTDDFLREVVFGDGDGNASSNDDENNNDIDFDNEDYYNYNKDTTSHTDHKQDEHIYIQHDTTQRGVDRQFTQMMREFNVDARLNDAYTDDPRAHGALAIDQYLRALEEFVVDKAGIDYETVEPRKNKGLIQQLRSMALHAGTDMGPGGEIHTTTLIPDKQTRFASEFQRETEEIRLAALQRVQEKVKESLDGNNELNGKKYEEDGEDDEEEEYIVRDVKDKSNRLDCETAVSTYSTYYNQPNVIRPPQTGKKRRGRGASTSTLATSPSTGATIIASRKNKEQENYYCDNNSDYDEEEEAPELDAQLLMFERRKDETKEEKKLRQQLAKQLNRERRNKKRELKQTYKVLEVDEAKRAKESQRAKKTVHFF